MNGHISGYYEAASSSRDRDWGYPSLASEDLLFSTGVRYTAIARARREVRNNPLLAGMLNGFATAMGTSRMRSRSSSRSFNAKKDLLWFRWAKRSFVNGLSQRQAERIIWKELGLCGEVFIVLTASGRQQLIQSELCGSPNSGMLAGEMNGIVRGPDGQPVSYRFGRATPSGSIDYSLEASTLVEARNVIHVMDPDRVSGGRGIPIIISVLSIARDLYEVMRAKTKQVKSANQAFAAITKNGGPAAARDAFGSPPAFGSNETTEVAAEDEADAADDAAEKREINLENGSVVILEDGEKIELLKAEYSASDYKELILFMAHAMSAPLGLPIELWLAGLADVSFSGAKSISTVWDDRRQEYISLMIDVYLTRMQFWRASKWTKEGDLPAHPDNDDDLVSFSFGRTPVLDEERRAKANALRVASGELTVMDVWESDGKYSEEVFEQRRVEYIKLLISAGELDESANHEDVHVPREWLLYGRLPGDGAQAAIAGVTAASATGDEADATASTDAAATGSVQSTALNGAQVQALYALAAQVAAGALPSATARSIAAAAFPLATPAQLDGIFRPLAGFKPAAPAQQ